MLHNEKCCDQKGKGLEFCIYGKLRAQGELKVIWVKKQSCRN